MMIISSSVRVTIDRPANRPPRASEPVSPMKILAGAAFHHRNPMQAPSRGRGDQGDVQRVADLVAARRETMVVAQQSWRNCQKEMIT